MATIVVIEIQKELITPVFASEFNNIAKFYEVFDNRVIVIVLESRLQNLNIFDNFDDYYKLALRLGTDKKFNKKIRDKINDNKHKIFKEKASVIEWEETLLKLNTKKPLVHESHT
jgi:tRNA G10  N-methylase Trm11